MTQDQLVNLIINLRCCSANLAIEIADKLVIGGCDNTKKLIFLNDYIKHLSYYNLSDNTLNYLTEDEFNNIVDSAKQICDICEENNSVNTITT